MTAEDFEAELQDLENSLKALEEPMEQLKGEFLSNLVAAVVEEAKRFIDEVVVADPELTAKQRGNLPMLKEALARYEQSVRETIPRVVGAAEAWPHHEPHRPWDRSRYGYSSNVAEQPGRRWPNDLKERLCTVFGPVGEMLIDAGFGPVILGRTSRGPGFVQTTSGGIWRAQRAPYQVTNRKDLAERLDAYRGKFAELYDAVQRKQAIEREKARHEAKALWDDA